MCAKLNYLYTPISVCTRRLCQPMYVASVYYVCIHAYLCVLVCMFICIVCLYMHINLYILCLCVCACLFVRAYTLGRVNGSLVGSHRAPHPTQSLVGGPLQASRCIFYALCPSLTITISRYDAPFTSTDHDSRFTK